MSLIEGSKLGSLFNAKGLLTGGSAAAGLVVAHGMEMDAIFYVFNTVTLGIVGYTLSDDVMRGIRNSRDYIRSLKP